MPNLNFQVFTPLVSCPVQNSPELSSVSLDLSAAFNLLEQPRSATDMSYSNLKEGDKERLAATFMNIKDQKTAMNKVTIIIPPSEA